MKFAELWDMYRITNQFEQRMFMANELVQDDNRVDADLVLTVSRDEIAALIAHCRNFASDWAISENPNTGARSLVRRGPDGRITAALAK
jgi:hypothetical protein